MSPIRISLKSIDHVRVPWVKRNHTMPSINSGGKRKKNRYIQLFNSHTDSGSTKTHCQYIFESFWPRISNLLGIFMPSKGWRRRQKFNDFLLSRKQMFGPFLAYFRSNFPKLGIFTPSKGWMWELGLAAGRSLFVHTHGAWAGGVSLAKLFFVWNIKPTPVDD